MARRTRPTTTRRPESSEPVRQVAVYTRRSTDEEHQPYSIEAQTLRLDAYIASQPGWVKVASFSENASAKDTHRPGLHAALAAARSGRIDVLLVLKVDRFSRRQRDLVALVEELTGLGVAFVSATEAFDTSTPAGRAMLQMLGTFAEFEREMIIDRVVAGMERHAAAGRWPGGVRPDGYHLDPATKRLVVDEERAPVVREIFDLYTSKRLGTRAIANLLNERRARTRTGGPWSAHTIRWLLTNPAYLGQVTFRDTTVQNAHPAIIDPATFTAAERLLAARGEARTHRAANSSEYHLTASAAHTATRASSAPPPAGAPGPTATTPAGPAPATAPPPATLTGSTPTPPTPPCSPTSPPSTATSDSSSRPPPAKPTSPATPPQTATAPN